MTRLTDTGIGLTTNGITRTTQTTGNLYPSQPRDTAATVDSYENAKPEANTTNPVLTASDVTDQSANFVADPYVYVPDANDSFTDWHMYFEIARSDYGVIGHATSTDDGLTWAYDQTSIDAGSHLSYPQVFRNEGTYYMIPNRGQNDYQPLYEATTFPNSWTEVQQWLSGVSHNYKDHNLFVHNDRWWYIVGTDDGATNGGVRAYYSDQGINDIGNVGSWTAHPNNPVVSNRPSAARGAGRAVYENDGQLIAWYQDTVEEYGDKARVYEITDLTTTSFNDSELTNYSPVVEESGSGWNSDRMHHYDPWYMPSNDFWRVFVDGYNGNAWTIGVYRADGKILVLVDDDFETGSLSAEWSGDTGAATVQNETVINGSYSLQLDAGPNELLNGFGGGDKVKSFSSYFRVSNATDATYWRLYDTGTRSQNVRVSGGDLEWYDGGSYNTLTTGISADTTYQLEFRNYDYGAGSYDVVLDGSTVGTGGFENSPSSHDEMSFRMGSSSHTAYFDDVYIDAS